LLAIYPSDARIIIIGGVGGGEGGEGARRRGAGDGGG